jgi:hypothetical protein
MVGALRSLPRGPQTQLRCNRSGVATHSRFCGQPRACQCIRLQWPLRCWGVAARGERCTWLSGHVAVRRTALHKGPRLEAVYAPSEGGRPGGGAAGLVGTTPSTFGTIAPARSTSMLRSLMTRSSHARRSSVSSFSSALQSQSCVRRPPAQRQISAGAHLASAPQMAAAQRRCRASGRRG